jgi:hypothetical protein
MVLDAAPMELGQKRYDFSDFVDVISPHTYVLLNSIDVFSRYTIALSDFIDVISLSSMDKTHHSTVRTPSKLDLSRRTPA